jgi:hypothetical protein
MSDMVLKQTLFGKKFENQKYRQPDLEYIHQELAKSGVTLT